MTPTSGPPSNLGTSSPDGGRGSGRFRSPCPPPPPASFSLPVSPRAPFPDRLAPPISVAGAPPVESLYSPFARRSWLLPLLRQRAIMRAVPVSPLATDGASVSPGTEEADAATSADPIALKDLDVCSIVKDRDEAAGTGRCLPSTPAADAAGKASVGLGDAGRHFLRHGDA